MATAESAPADLAALPTARWRPVLLYYSLACGLSWIIWAPLVLGRDGLKLLPIAPSLPVVISAGTLGPMIAAILTNRLQTGRWWAFQFLPPRRSQALWLVLGPILVLLCVFVVFPALVSKGAPSSWRWHPGVLAGIFVPMFNYNLFGGPLFEEFGWRGFLQSHLQHFFRPPIAAAIVAVLWAAWHLPIFLVNGWSSAPPFSYLLILIGLSLVMAFAFNRSGQSVAAAILMHSAFNSAPRFIGPFLDGTSIREQSAISFWFPVSFLLVGAALVLATRGRQ